MALHFKNEDGSIRAVQPERVQGPGYPRVRLRSTLGYFRVGSLRENLAAVVRGQWALREDMGTR